MKILLIVLSLFCAFNLSAQNLESKTSKQNSFQGTSVITPVDQTGKLTIDGITVLESNYTPTHSAILTNNSEYLSSIDNALYWKDNLGDTAKIHTQNIQELTGITLPTLKANTVTTFTGTTAVIATLESKAGTWLVSTHPTVSTLQFANGTITNVQTGVTGGVTADIGFTYIISSTDGVNYQLSKLGGGVKIDGINVYATENEAGIATLEVGVIYGVTDSQGNVTLHLKQ